MNFSLSANMSGFCSDSHYYQLVSHVRNTSGVTIYSNKVFANIFNQVSFIFNCFADIPA